MAEPPATGMKAMRMMMMVFERTIRGVMLKRVLIRSEEPNYITALNICDKMANTEMHLTVERYRRGECDWYLYL